MSVTRTLGILSQKTREETETKEQNIHPTKANTGIKALSEVLGKEKVSHRPDHTKNVQEGLPLSRDLTAFSSTENTRTMRYRTPAIASSRDQ